MSNEYFYTGKGERSESSDAIELPEVDLLALKDPAGYIAEPGLVAAIDVALRLGMPLLLTGEPGVGKSRLADSLAWELKLGAPLTFVVKSDTQAKDLFYQMDTVGRFHAAQVAHAEQSPDPRNFLQFNALGKALLYAQEPSNLKQRLGDAAFVSLQHPGSARASVVLIDEIDKAPRDVPNDLLHELDNMEFSVNELAYGCEQHVFGLDASKKKLRPLVVMTSNSEKSLPDAFLRRCVYYHLSFPSFDEHNDGGVSVQAIVAKRLYHRYGESGTRFVQEALAFFQFVRKQSLIRQPSLGELLNWLDFLLQVVPITTGEASFINMDTLTRLNSVKGVLLKDSSDHLQAENMLEQWFKQAGAK